MSKAPIVILGTAAVVGIAIAASRKGTTEATTTAAPPVKGTSAQDYTAAQKKKLEDWAKKKGVPVQQAYDLAKQVLTTKF
jgi:hypothetical protein